MRICGRIQFSHADFVNQPYARAHVLDMCMFEQTETDGGEKSAKIVFKRPSRKRKQQHIQPAATFICPIYMICFPLGCMDKNKHTPQQIPTQVHTHTHGALGRCGMRANIKNVLPMNRQHKQKLLNTDFHIQRRMKSQENLTNY